MIFQTEGKMKNEMSRDQLLEEIEFLNKRIADMENQETVTTVTDEKIAKLVNIEDQLLGLHSLEEKLKMITEGLVDIFNADFARIWLILPGDLCDKGCIYGSFGEDVHSCSDKSHCLHLLASSGRYTHINGDHRRVPLGSYKIGKIGLGLFPKLISNDVTMDLNIHDLEWAEKNGLVSFAGFQLISKEMHPVGVLALFSKQEIYHQELKLIEDLAHTTSQVIQSGKYQKSLQMSEERFRAVAESAIDAIVTTDMDGEIIYYNNSLNNIFGYTGGELKGKSLTLLMPERNQEIYIKELEKFRSSGEHRLIGKVVRTTGLKKDKTEFPFEMSLSRWESNEKTYLTSIIRDLTERKKMELQIQESLEEKELLLKEIHHRVKNNLMVIFSLLNLQSQYIKDKDDYQMLLECQNRTKSMALIHERLYRSDNLKSIDFSDYVKSLSKDLLRTYSVDQSRVKLNMELERVDLDVNVSIPLGLIVNELISNSLKYAFPDGEGEINLTIKSIGNDKVLKVSDNGVGIPEDIDFKNADTLGFQLINNLTKQIDGEIHLDQSVSTTFTITLKDTIT